MKYYLGIDGGGTKTKVTIIDENQNTLYIGQSGPSSIDTVSNKETLKAIKDALVDAKDKITNLKFDSIFAGIGGIVFDKDCHMVESLLSKLDEVDSSTLLVARNDMENALYSGKCFLEGMTLICGTGTVAFGIDSLGNQHKCGGWSYKEGDAGSAYDLGYQAIHYLIRAYDGRYEKDAFAEEVADKVGMEQATDILNIMDSYYDQRTKIAKLAPLVTKYANLNHKHAKAIVDRATDELTLSVRGIYNNLRLKNKTLVVVGSLGNANGYFKDQLHQKIKAIDQNINIIPPLIDPSLAAAIMAFHNKQKNENNNS